MSKQDDGGYAFPVPMVYDGGACETVNERGMSLRDYFAGQMVMGVFASGSHRRVAAEIEGECEREDITASPVDIGHFAEERIAAMAYAMADAMLKERTK